MRAIFETRESRQVDIHYVNTEIPGVVKENFEGFFIEHSDLSLEEVLQVQESLYQSLQITVGTDGTKASTSTDSNFNQEQSGGEKQVPNIEGDSSQVSNINTQLELDEALAIALHESEDPESPLGSTYLGETTGDEDVNRNINSADTSAQDVEQDDIDPDDMTYEELQSLGEAIGIESKGLSDELISYLPSVKYKTGFFSKDKHEECMICLMAYKNRDMLTTLPCQHQYHSNCVKKWLKLNKACPVCYEEVFGSQS